jgi:hypothetical protein
MLRSGANTAVSFSKPAAAPLFDITPVHDGAQNINVQGPVVRDLKLQPSYADANFARVSLAGTILMTTAILTPP